MEIELTWGRTKFKIRKHLKMSKAMLLWRRLIEFGKYPMIPQITEGHKQWNECWLIVSRAELKIVTIPVCGTWEARYSVNLWIRVCAGTLKPLPAMINWILQPYSRRLGTKNGGMVSKKVELQVAEFVSARTSGYGVMPLNADLVMIFQRGLPPFHDYQPPLSITKKYFIKILQVLVP